jgi:hypothetical protein
MASGLPGNLEKGVNSPEFAVRSLQSHRDQSLADGLRQAEDERSIYRAGCEFYEVSKVL